MFYRFLQFIVPPFAFRVYFRRIFYSNLKKVPLEKPLLFVGNHQNSFMDGVLVGSYLPQPIHFTMRADMFRKPFGRFCLRELNVSPVYRMEEGFENVHKNIEAFTAIYDVLKQNGNFIMFSEGICVQEKRLQRLRKGTARLAFGAEEKYGLDVNIVPVGINYTYPARFRKEVMINFHESFSIKELTDIYKAHPAKALLAFNDKCNEGLLREVIIVEDPKNDWLAEELLKMGRNNMILPFFRWMFHSDDRRIAEKRIADRVNHLAKTSPEGLESLTEKVKTYTGLLSKSGLRDENVARKLDWGWLRYLTVIAGFPVFLAGYITNLIPFIVPRSLAKKFIKDSRFTTGFYVSTGTVLYLIYFPLVLILAAIFAGWIGFLTGLLVPVAGYLVLYYQEIFRERLNTLRFSLKSLTNRSLIDDLKNQRKEIQTILDNIKID
jgi:glycerol-3-phosphate O-acyltransferase/dihydroxyacetone phosphate acyltransferase